MGYYERQLEAMAQSVAFNRHTLTLESRPSIHTAKLGGSASSLFRICPRTRFSVWREGSPYATERLRGLLTVYGWRLQKSISRVTGDAGLGVSFSLL